MVLTLTLHWPWWHVNQETGIILRHKEGDRIKEMSPMFPLRIGKNNMIFLSEHVLWKNIWTYIRKNWLRESMNYGSDTSKQYIFFLPSWEKVESLWKTQETKKKNVNTLCVNILMSIILYRKDFVRIAW